jgi:hexokinase
MFLCIGVLTHTLCDRDESADLGDVAKFGQRVWSATLTLEHRKLCQEVCHAVLDRAAKLTAMAICTTAERVHARRPKPAQGTASRPVGVAIDGSVYEKQPRFRRVLAETAERLFAHTPIELHLVKDGSSIGAAVLAAESPSASL